VQTFTSVIAQPSFFWLQAHTSSGCTSLCFLTSLRGATFFLVAVFSTLSCLSCLALPTAQLREIDAGGAQTERARRNSEGTKAARESRSGLKETFL